MSVVFENDWANLLRDEFQKDYYKRLRSELAKEYREDTVYPDMYDIFNALHYCAYSEVKVVILGQDPYHNENQAHGLSFSVPQGVAIPASLNNIYKELNDDLAIKPASHGCLISWAKQGVLLLNSVLTVKAHKPASHKTLGWENFTDRVIELVNKKQTPVVFILWGNFAQSKRALITNPIHLVLCSSHPSPLSANRGFFGSKPFSKTNDFLLKTGQTPINWAL